MADVLPASVMILVKQFVMAGAKTSGTGVAELGGLLAATFLVSFQFLDVAEASDVANLHLLTAPNNWRKTRGGTYTRSDSGSRSASCAGSSLSPSVLSGSRLLTSFG